MQKQVTSDHVHPQGPSDRTSGSRRADSESVKVQFVEEHVNVHSDDEMPEVTAEIASRQDPATVEVEKTRASRSSRS